MPGLLAADIVTVCAHVLDHVAVADLGPGQPQSEVLQIALQTEIGHDGRHDARRGQPVIGLPGLGNDAISWSPSITAPFSSTMITRSASPSSAMPISARTSWTLRDRASVDVEPQSWLMLKPSGVTPMEITSAPSSQRASGATL